jgi:hypothetical protein
MRHPSGEVRLQPQEGSFLRRNATAIQLVALYSSVALIAGIVLSTSVHPF